ncbi:11424_t:CDS:1 [Scutellospora calospora]|uniref:11424_t:CDS:1 n=1 Tax=Scutellospora calospora TaxID=85575 RepID=A0ACA9JZJ8_9GLOM|nr:11424_t:CDS:1 [Scutellospora calospora]
MEDTKFILSIDGGGIRGIIPAKIIAYIEKTVTEKIKEENPEVNIKCADLFDIIAGTSTGSILALSLTVPNDNNRPTYDGEFMVKFYKENGNHVFPSFSTFKHVTKVLKSAEELMSKTENLVENFVTMGRSIEQKITKSNETESKVEKRTSFFGLGWLMGGSGNETKNEIVTKSKTVDENKDKIKTTDITVSTTEETEGEATLGLIKPKYTPDGLESLLETYFGESKINKTVNDVGIFITAYNITSCERTFFTEKDDFRIQDVIRASSAAPTFFPAKEISSNLYVDGGVFMNNPTTRAYLEARKRFPKSKFVVVSLGTGYYKTSLNDLGNSGALQWLLPIIDLLMDVEVANHDDTMKLLAELDGVKYYRIQPNLDEKPNMSDVSKEEVEKLTNLGDETIKDPTYKLDEIVDLLVDKCKKKKIYPTVN